jgi:hypothetical protein
MACPDHSSTNGKWDHDEALRREVIARMQSGEARLDDVARLLDLSRSLSAFAVYSLVRRFRGRNFTVDDLLQEGHLRLLEIVPTYNPDILRRGLTLDRTDETFVFQSVLRLRVGCVGGCVGGRGPSPADADGGSVSFGNRQLKALVRMPESTPA